MFEQFHDSNNTSNDFFSELKNILSLYLVKQIQLISLINAHILIDLNAYL